MKTEFEIHLVEVYKIDFKETKVGCPIVLSSLR